MSTTATRRTLAEAIQDAAAFRELFSGTYERWEIAGSARRRKEAVGDVEHVVIPRFADAPSDFLFVQSKKVNLLLKRRDKLLAERAIAQHVYGTSESGAPRYRWGDTNCGCEFRGFNHEIFCADMDNWGSKLAICTGPADFSRMLVTRLRHNLHRNHQGRVWRCITCHHYEQVMPDSRECPSCEGTGLKPVMPIPTHNEGDFFRLAGVAWVEPEKRQ